MQLESAKVVTIVVREAVQEGLWANTYVVKGKEIVMLIMMKDETQQKEGVKDKLHWFPAC